MNTYPNYTLSYTTGIDDLKFRKTANNSYLQHKINTFIPTIHNPSPVNPSPITN